MDKFKLRIIGCVRTLWWKIKKVIIEFFKKNKAAAEAIAGLIAIINCIIIIAIKLIKNELKFYKFK